MLPPRIAVAGRNHRRLPSYLASIDEVCDGPDARCKTRWRAAGSGPLCMTKVSLTEEAGMFLEGRRRAPVPLDARTSSF